MSMPKSKLISSAVMLAIFGLTLTFALLTASKAWFSENKVVKANGMAVEVKAPPAINVKCETYDMVKTENDTLYFNAASGQNAALQPYQVDNPQNIYMLLKFTVSIEDGSGLGSLPALKLTAITSADDFMSGQDRPLIKYLHEDQNNPTSPLKIVNDHYVKINKGTQYEYGVNGYPEGAPQYDNSISSIIVFNVATPNANTENVTVGNETVTCITVPSTSAGIGEKKQFVDTSTAPPTIPDDKKTIDLHQTAASTETYEFYMLVSYDGSLLSELFAENIGNPNLMSEQGFMEYGGVDFISDFVFHFEMA